MRKNHVFRQLLAGPILVACAMLVAHPANAQPSGGEPQAIFAGELNTPFAPIGACLQPQNPNFAELLKNYEGSQAVPSQSSENGESGSSQTEASGASR